jgi:hypothetical protein
MLARAVEVSANRKLGPVAATFVSQVSCPEYCPWYDGGKWVSPCYANNGFQGFMTARLNQGTGDHLDAAREEAELIRGLSSERTLRLHVVGDCKDQFAAETVSKLRTSIAPAADSWSGHTRGPGRMFLGNRGAA